MADKGEGLPGLSAELGKMIIDQMTKFVGSSAAIGAAGLAESFTKPEPAPNRRPDPVATFEVSTLPPGVEWLKIEWRIDRPPWVDIKLADGKRIRGDVFPEQPA